MTSTSSKIRIINHITGNFAETAASVSDLKANLTDVVASDIGMSVAVLSCNTRVLLLGARDPHDINRR